MHKAPLHDNFTVGKLLPQFYLDLGAFCAYERVGVKNLLRRLSDKRVAWVLHLPWSLLELRRSLSGLMQFPSDSGIGPVKKKRLVNVRGNKL